MPANGSRRRFRRLAHGARGRAGKDGRLDRAARLRHQRTAARLPVRALRLMASLAIERRAGGVLRVELARDATLNAFDEAMIAEIDAAFAAAAVDTQVRSVVLAARGRAFCAGADIHWMQRQSVAAEGANLEDARRFAAMLHRIAACPKPTIARVHGACMGGGVGLACACDFVIAGESARFSVSEARFGILPAVISPYLIAAGAV